MKVDILVRFYYDNAYAHHFLNYAFGLGFDHIHVLFQSGQPPLDIAHPNVTVYPHNYSGNGVLHKLNSIVSTDADWLLICDTDEYLYLKDYANIQEFCATIPADVDQVQFHWAMVEHFQITIGDKDLFDCLATHTLYSNPHRKSMIRLKGLGIKQIPKINPHTCFGLPNSYIWNQRCKPSALNHVEVEMYQHTNYPFLIHFHTRSLQDMFLKGMVTNLKGKQFDMVKFAKDISETNYASIQKYTKVYLPFDHGSKRPIPMNIQLCGSHIDSKAELAQFEHVCKRHNLPYESFQEMLVYFEQTYSALFRKNPTEDTNTRID